MYTITTIKKTYLSIGLLILALFIGSLMSMTGKMGKGFNPFSGFFAAIGESTRPGAFTLSPAALTCVNGVPKVNLTWTSSARAVSYTIFRHEPTSTLWPLLTRGLTVERFTDGSFAPGPGEYKYQAKSLSIIGRAAYSNIVSVTVPATCNGVVSTPVVTTPPPLPVTVTASTPSPLPLITAPSAAPVVPVNSASQSIKWGAYVGWQENQMADFESRVGSSTNLRAVFVHWGNESGFPFYLTPYVKDKGKTLVIFWEATDYNYTTTEQPRFNYDSVIRGDWDAYLKSFALSAKVYGGPVILLPYSEMNGDWFTISGTKNGNTPAKHIAAWRHIRDLFRGSPNVLFGWAPNNDSVPDTVGNQLEQYYPGDAYVDIVGVDGFNFNYPWQTFSQVFDASLAKLKLYNKPVYIFSFASAGGSGKAAWITDALTVQIPKHPEIKGWIWFNENKEQNWLVWSDTASTEAFKRAIGGR